MSKKATTSAVELLQISRQIAKNEGFNKINIRKVAQRAHVTVSVVYNYFTNKDRLISATFESIWEQFFHHSQNVLNYDSFDECLQRLVTTFQDSQQAYPDILIEYLHFMHHQAIQELNTHMINTLTIALQRQYRNIEKILHTVSPNKFVTLVVNNIVLALANHDPLVILDIVKIITKS